MCPNSRGSHRHDNGVFKVKYSDKNKLFTTIAVVDKKNANVIDQVTQDRKNLTLAYEQQLRNGNNAEGEILRYEFALIIGRHLYGVKKDEVILSKTEENGIRSGDNSYGKILRYEAVLMVMRAVFGKGDTDELLLDKAKRLGIWNGNNPYNKCTR